MTHHCPKCSPAATLIWQPAKLRFYCPKCHLNFTPREVRVVEGNPMLKLPNG